MLQVEITLCVVEGDAFYQLLQAGVDIGILAVFYPVADEVAQNSAEVIVTGIAQEGTGVSQHTNEVVVFGDMESLDP